VASGAKEEEAVKGEVSVAGSLAGKRPARAPVAAKARELAAAEAITVVAMGNDVRSAVNTYRSLCLLKM